MRTLATRLIQGYRYLISPFFPPSCRFVPSCSEYALEAVQQHGVLTGTYLSAKRICRCHPLAPGGHDPVPPNKEDLHAESCGIVCQSNHTTGQTRGKDS